MWFLQDDLSFHETNIEIERLISKRGDVKGRENVLRHDVFVIRLLRRWLESNMCYDNPLAVQTEPKYCPTSLEIGLDVCEEAVKSWMKQTITRVILTLLPTRCPVLYIYVDAYITKHTVNIITLSACLLHISRRLVGLSQERHPELFFFIDDSSLLPDRSQSRSLSSLVARILLSVLYIYIRILTVTALQLIMSGSDK